MMTLFGSGEKVRKMWMRLVIGSIVSLMITIIGALVITALVNKRNISLNGINNWIIGTLIIAAYSGSSVAIQSRDLNKLITSLFSSVLYLGILLTINLLVCRSNSDRISTTAIIVFAGGISAAIFNKTEKKTREIKKLRKRYR